MNKKPKKFFINTFRKKVVGVIVALATVISGGSIIIYNFNKPENKKPSWDKLNTNRDITGLENDVFEKINQLEARLNAKTIAEQKELENKISNIELIEIVQELADLKEEVIKQKLSDALGVSASEIDLIQKSGNEDENKIKVHSSNTYTVSYSYSWIPTGGNFDWYINSDLNYLFESYCWENKVNYNNIDRRKVLGECRKSLKKIENLVGVKYETTIYRNIKSKEIKNKDLDNKYQTSNEIYTINDDNNPEFETTEPDLNSYKLTVEEVKEVEEVVRKNQLAAENNRCISRNEAQQNNGESR